MDESRKDTLRAAEAASRILDGRSPVPENEAAILVTLEHTLTTVLLALYKSPREAAAMLEEGLIPCTIERLARYKR